MRLIIITGISGAGRTTALKTFEDLGCFCADNIPPILIPQFISIMQSQTVPPENVAVVADVRMGEMFDSIYGVIDSFKEDKSINLEVLFLDSSDDVILSRFEQTRRNHPVTSSGKITSGLTAEREILQRIKELSDYVIDTSDMKPRDLSVVLERSFFTNYDSSNQAKVSVITFGYKRGVPLDVDMVFDMRFIPNPFYLDSLKRDSGLSDNVYNYVLSFPIAQQFLKQTTELILTLTPNYLEQDKKHIVIGIGCTGGMHRSVAMGKALAESLKEKGLKVELEHRDLELEQHSVLERFPR